MQSSIHIAVEQTTKLAPKQIQSISILQMDMGQLESYILKELEENPVLDQSVSSTTSLPLPEKSSLFSMHAPYPSASFENPVSALEYATAPDEINSLEIFLQDQLERLRLPPILLSTCLYIVHLLDPRGYLPQDEIDFLHAELPVPQKWIDLAIKTVRKLDPAGIGAKDLPDCLLLQLDRINAPCETAKRIVNGHLPELAQKSYVALGRKLHLPTQEIRRAAAQIQALNPRPVAAFVHSSHLTQYIKPDAYIVSDHDGIQVIISDPEGRRLGLDQHYLELVSTIDDPNAKAYLTDKISQAKWLLSCVSQRKSTLERCIQCIVNAQLSFFTTAKGRLNPLSLSDISRSVNLHESTVSRALQGKYLMCFRGVFPLRHFLSNAVKSVDGTTVSSADVKVLLAELIQAEDKKLPLSDEQLQQLLCCVNKVDISRRTVAKYRSELNIPTAAIRRVI